jgi:hypothetical protein
MMTTMIVHDGHDKVMFDDHVLLPQCIYFVQWFELLSSQP